MSPVLNLTLYGQDVVDGARENVSWDFFPLRADGGAHMCLNREGMGLAGL